MSNIPLIMFLVFIAITLGIPYWASKRSAGANAYFAASRQIKGWQNGIAVAGDYMSAASFLGIAGIIAFQGYDGFMFSVGWLVAYLTVLLVIAEPLRNGRQVHDGGCVGVPAESAAGAGHGVAEHADSQHVLHDCADGGSGCIGEIVVGGSGHVQQGSDRSWNSDDRVRGVRRDAGHDRVQIVKAILLMAGTFLLSILVMAHFHFSFGEFFGAIAHVTYTDAKGATVVKDLLRPGLRFKPPYGPLDLISLGLALIFGTAGLPHILVRFYTVPDAKTARHSVVWAMVLIGSFYIMTTFLGFGAATIVVRTSSRLTAART